MAFAADEDVEIRRLQGVLGAINQEIQAEFQHYQMVLQARRETMQILMYGALATPDPVNFEAVKEEQRKLLRRDDELRSQLDQILARIRDLEARKQPLIDRLYELAATARAAAPAAVPERLPAPAAPPAPLPPAQTPRY
ncbi:MAG TPA: hypothetical protein VLC55_13340 [Burkholderiales bacterium]|nr:hypothetical protein [Burkholderiales bacterium]